MSKAEHFVIANNLQPADAILLTKKFMGMLNHYAVYLGRDQWTNKPIFAANYTSGVQYLSPAETEGFLEILVPTRIEKFHGTMHQRNEAINRAISMVGKTTYNLIFNNCEHYKNFVMFNKKYSSQVDTAGKTAMVTGGLAALAGAVSGNGKAVGLGLLFMALGAIAVEAADQDK